MTKPQPIESADDTPEQAESGTSSRPAARFSGTGGISVAVWKHKTDDGWDRYSVRVDRSYKDDEGEFQSTPYLRDLDLLRVQKLLGAADDWIEQDKAKYRASAQSTDQGQGR